MNIYLPSNILEKMPKRTTKLLTLELELQRLAEFSAAAEIFGARSKSTFLNQYVVQKIREAKSMVTPEEFQELFEKHKESIEKRSSEIKERSARKASSNLEIQAGFSTNTQIQEQPGLHRNTKGVGKKKGIKDAEVKLNKIDPDKHDYNYGDFDDPDKDLKKR